MSASKLQSNNLVGNIPANWNTTLLRFLLKEKITDGPHETPEFVDEGYPFLSVDGIQKGELVFEGCRFISEEAHVEYSKKVKPIKGDLLMGKAASTGKIAQVKVDFEFSIWSPLAWIRPNEMISSDFLELALKSDYCQAQIDMLCTNNTQKNISMQDIPRIRIHHPHRTDQDDISRFLNEKISKLNNVEEQLNLELKLLEQKRSAVITQAVTEGIEPNVLTKETGVGFFPEIPIHWKLGCMKRIVDEERPITYGIVQCGPDLGSGIPYVRPVDMTDEGGVNMEKMQYTSKEIAAPFARSTIRQGDLVVSIGPSFGKVMTVPPELDGGNLTQGTARVAVDAKYYTDFFFWAMRSSSMAQQWDSVAQGATFSALNLEPLWNSYVSIPPVEEQIEISNYLRKETKMIDQIIHSNLAKIEKLTEYRTALISAAVTGKIDVRGYGNER